jgi:hypothetical protein
MATTSTTRTSATATSPGDARSTRDRLLTEQLRFDARTRRGLSNHLPMALVALERLGAGADALQATFDAYADRSLDPRRDEALLDTMRARLADDGVEATVRRQLAGLASSPASEWFHSMIRLAYALDAAHDAMVAGALADWAARRRPLSSPAPRGAEPVRSASVAFAALRRAELDHPASHADLEAVARQPAFVAGIADIRVDLELDDLAAAAIAAHLTGGNLATLHLVTGVHAARVVGRWIEDDAVRAELARRTVQAVAAGYLAGGALPLPDADHLDACRAAAPRDWHALHAGAVRSDDAHVAKLVYTCHAELSATGDPLYAWVAARAVGVA